MEFSDRILENKGVNLDSEEEKLETEWMELTR